MTAQLTDGTRERSHLELRHLHKEYPGGVTAVEDITLSLARGELLVLVGPSGCGKSTTLRCIAGIEEPTGGDILIDDDSVVGRRPEDRDIAMVFQNYALYPHKTARQNIGFGLRMTTDRPDQAVREKVEQVAETLGITELLDKKPGSLSGGQQQRVALGRAIVRDPRGVPPRRTALESRRDAPVGNANRNPATPTGPRRDHRLRHARPDRGHDHG